MEVTIRPIERDEEFEEFQEVIKRAWGAADIDIPPKHLLVSAKAHGGLVIGAFDEAGKMVGILFGIPAFREERVYHYSHMCGVLPERRFQGVGYQLKLRQREHALSQNLELVMWTYDPLESANGHFNLTKLGAICRTYKRSFYGTMRDALNVGLESDRFLVEWWVRSERVKQKVEKGVRAFTFKNLIERGAKIVNHTVRLGELLKPSTHDLGMTENQLLIEVPENIQKLKSADPSLAREWRSSTREIFENYFAEGYVATEVVREEIDGFPRAFYLLETGFSV